MASDPPGVAAGSGSGPALTATYYTDPLCCWSWAFEPQLRRLRFAFAGRIAWRTRLGGMIGGWDEFSDPINAVSRPSQMGPLWLHVREVSGMPTRPEVWVNDPPTSSWPASSAVKAAELQSARAGEALLRRLREVLMVEGGNIAAREAIAAGARACADENPGLLDAGRVLDEMDGAAARAALLDDVKEARFRGIGRFPNLTLRGRGGPPVVLVGWRPYAALLDAARTAAPDLGSERHPASPDAYRTYWGRITEREVQEACGADGAPARPDAPAPGTAPPRADRSTA